jgi:ribosomal protein S18 acetylase RimI-like enzyme
MNAAIRKPEYGELKALSMVHYQAWTHAYKGVYPDWFMATRNPDFFYGLWRTFLDDDTRPVLVATTDGELCGFVRYGRPNASSRPQTARTGEILTMYLLAGHRGNGIGTALLNAAELEMARQGCRDALLFVIQAMPASVGFYEKNGWRITGEPQRADFGGFDPFLLRMEKTLEPSTGG